MPDPWTPEHTVSPELAQALCRSQFPELDAGRLQRLGAGWDNTVYRLGEWVFRFPRRELAATLLPNEYRVLEALSATPLPAAIPQPAFLGRATAAFPWPFVGYRWLPGRTACRADLDAARRGALAVPLACFLAALHQLERPPVAGPDTLGRLVLARRLAHSRTRLEAARRQGLISDAAPWEPILADTPTGYRATASALVHGDLYARHLLLDERAQLCGVIDWGDVHWGDPACDLAVVFGFLPAEARPRFWEAYGPVSDERRRAARYRALQYAVVLLLYAAHTGDEALLREARASLSFLAH